MAATRITWRYLTFSAQNALKQVFADMSITNEMMLFFVKGIVNKLKAARGIAMNYKSGSYVTVFDNVAISIDYNGTDFWKKVKYSELPSSILDFDLDKAVESIHYRLPDSKCVSGWRWQRIYRGTMNSIEGMYCEGFEKPNPDNPFFIRRNNTIYYFGLEKVPVTVAEMHLWTSESPIIGLTNWDDEVLIDEEDVIEVCQRVIGLGRFLLTIPADKRQEGSDDRELSPQQIQAIERKSIEQP